MTTSLVGRWAVLKLLGGLVSQVRDWLMALFAARETLRPLFLGFQYSHPLMERAHRKEDPELVGPVPILTAFDQHWQPPLLKVPAQDSLVVCAWIPNPRGRKDTVFWVRDDRGLLSQHQDPKVEFDMEMTNL